MSLIITFMFDPAKLQMNWASASAPGICAALRPFPQRRRPWSSPSRREPARRVRLVVHLDRLPSGFGLPGVDLRPGAVASHRRLHAASASDLGDREHVRQASLSTTRWWPRTPAPASSGSDEGVRRRSNAITGNAG
jgi:hypothetical protein